MDNGKLEAVGICLQGNTKMMNPAAAMQAPTTWYKGIK